MKQIFTRLYYFFPVNLLLLHLKKNHVLLLFWLFFFAAVKGLIGKSLGMHYLFLDPEYLGSPNFWSFSIVGICLGVFIISFFITSYIIDGHRYKFVLLDTHPFATYSLNNSPIPLLFIFFYIYQIYHFQIKQGQETGIEILTHLSGLFFGVVSMVFLVIIYFSKTNRNVLKDVISSIDKGLSNRKIHSEAVLQKVMDLRKSKYKIKSYLSPIIKLKKVPKNLEVDRTSLTKVFDQNHLNAVFLQLILFLIIMSLGFYKDYELFKIPAGASAFLFFSFALMIVGALFYWLRAWSLSATIILFFSINLLMKNGFFDYKFQAFGLNYKISTVNYNKKLIDSLNSQGHIEKDKKITLQILNNWRAKFGTKKPKMVIITSSGGGQRSAMWTTCVLHSIDKQLSKSLMYNATLITGASGGIIGSSYYRELYLRDQKDEVRLLDQKNIDNISKDILNPMVFSILVNDLIFPYQTIDFKGKTYSAGRGYAFEKNLNQNVGGILDKSLGDYEKDEFTGNIPMVILAPTIANDARKLFISSHPVSYLNEQYNKNNYSPRDRGVDFLSMFEKNDPKDLKFTSALRMSATFPYITPNVHLPTNPNLEIMDAGLSDNFGTSDALKYLLVFKDWINQNTSGVVIISIRDKEKDPQVKIQGHQTLVDRAFNPIDALYSNWDFVQDCGNDQLFELVIDKCTVPIYQNLFEYIPANADEEKASLSWHLTSKEKISIQNNINQKNNQASLNQVIDLLKN